MKRVLLDHCVTMEFLDELPDHEVTHARQRGWQAMANGELVRAANAEFDVLLTTDKNMEYQTSLKGLDLCVVVADVLRNDIHELRAIREELRQAINNAGPGKFVRVTKP